MRFTKIIVVGVGGIGFWLTWILCRQFSKSVTTIDIYDPDNLEGGTGDTRITGSARTKLFKVDLCTMQIRNIMRDRVPEQAYNRKFTPEDVARYQDPSHTLIIDCSDGELPERRAWWDAARTAGFTIIRGSYEGRTEQAGGVAVVANSLPFVRTGDTAGGYNSRPSIALSLLAAGLVGEVVNELMSSGVFKGLRVEIPVTPQEAAHAVGE